MGRLGISIYPEKSDLSMDKAYIEKAVNLGYTRIFMNMLSIDEDKKTEFLKRYTDTIKYARKLEPDMEIFLDINPLVLKTLGVDPQDLSFFADLGVDGVRLDMGFSGKEEAKMTQNEYNLKVEINMSMHSYYLNRIFDFFPNAKNLVGCHNFYPQAYTALGLDFFNECTDKFVKYGLTTAAFVTSQVGEIGPWALQEGLPTLEMHRNLDIETQVRHLKKLNTIDDIIIGNAYASDEELALAAKAFFTTESYFNVELYDNISEVEKLVVVEPESIAEKAIATGHERLKEIAKFFDVSMHSYRADSSDYLIRSSGMRFLLAAQDIKHAGAKRDIKRGDILVLNNNYEQYKGEVQIALIDRPADDKVNIVGRIKEDELILLDYLKRSEKFRFQVR